MTNLKEKSEDFYNNLFESNTNQYSLEYTKSHYLPIWQKIIKLLENKSKNYKILDLGCGPGQFAKYIDDQKFKNYIGIDFSISAIKKSQKKLPQFIFKQFDFNSKQWNEFIKKDDSDIYLALEVLEHINKDLDLLKSLKRSKEIIITLPDFICEGHVRCFKNKEEVFKRYESLIDIKHYDSYKKWHLIYGLIK
jgi:2-polyprenyl-3-methyl-5-hydroxy-6-metoxy-1,4-benzoquinol methylase